MDFKDMMKVANEIDAEAVRLRDKLIADVCDLPLKGKYINDGKNGGPVIAIVNFSDLGNNWSPEYHLPPAQAKAIKDYLLPPPKFGKARDEKEKDKSHKGVSLDVSRNTAKGICAAVRKMLANGFVIVGNNKITLNDRTLKAIRKSELGKYVINTHPIDNNSVL